eukprot:365154-Chlamydomonas_euryale.AAC.15
MVSRTFGPAQHRAVPSVTSQYRHRRPRLPPRAPRHCSTRLMAPRRLMVSHASVAVWQCGSVAVWQQVDAARHCGSRLMVSRTISPTPSAVNSRKPDATTVCSTVLGSRLPPRSASTSSSTRYPPSSAGSGSTLTTARLMLMMAQYCG